jgi:tripartite-type tricarboxylate transporter receptor subunit TctC
MPFDAVADFTHMGMLVEAPMVLLVRAQSPFQTLDQYVAAARTKPVRYGTSGIGSANHLFGELLKIEGRRPSTTTCPTRAAPRRCRTCSAARSTACSTPSPPTWPAEGRLAARAGRVHAGAAAGPALIPTFAEARLPSLTGSQWLGLSAPKGLPAPIAQRLTALIPEVLAKPDVMARLEDLQTLPRKTPVLGDDFSTLIKSQIDTWTKVARRAKVEVIA